MRVNLRFSIEVPDGTDTELVREAVDAEFEYAAAGGGPCNWRSNGWVPGSAEFNEVSGVEAERNKLCTLLQDLLFAAEETARELREVNLA